MSGSVRTKVSVRPSKTSTELGCVKVRNTFIHSSIHSFHSYSSAARVRPSSPDRSRAADPFSRHHICGLAGTGPGWVTFLACALG